MEGKSCIGGRGQAWEWSLRGRLQAGEWSVRGRGQAGKRIPLLTQGDFRSKVTRQTRPSRYPKMTKLELSGGMEEFGYKDAPASNSNF